MKEGKTSPLRRLLGFAAGWVSVVVLDQLAKALIVSNLADDATTSRSGIAAIPVLGDVLRLDLVYNSGTAFRWFLPLLNPTLAYGLLFALAAFLLIRYGLARQAAVVRWAVVLVLGGGLGNFIDRIRIGRVVDFVSVGIPTSGWRFPTFNLADVAICTGAGLLAWRELGGIRRFQGLPCKGLPTREPTEFEPNDRI